MVEIQVVNGQGSPFLFCDVCGERIEDAGKAAVVYENFRPDKERLKMLHVHKGSIDGRTCHHEADQARGAFVSHSTTLLPRSFLWINRPLRNAQGATVKDHGSKLIGLAKSCNHGVDALAFLYKTALCA